MKQLILIRGLPGSGKSTLAKTLAYEMKEYCQVDHFEADMYFVDKDGNYNYNPREIGLAHEWCQRNTRMSLFDTETTGVIVSNTFTTKKELRPYFEIAKNHGIVPLVYLAQNQFQNVHSVPQEVLDKMKARFEYDLTDLFKEFQ